MKEKWTQYIISCFIVRKKCVGCVERQTRYLNNDSSPCFFITIAIKTLANTLWTIKAYAAFAHVIHLHRTINYA